MTVVRPNWPFLAVVAVSVVSPVVVAALPFDPRLVSSALGFVAFLLLAGQFVCWYRETPTSTKAGVVLVLMSLLAGAIGQAQMAARPQHVDLTVAFHLLIIQRVSSLAFALFYRRVIEMGPVNPWVKRRVTHKSGPSAA